jgi:acyl-CoA thioester hydrolase
MEHPRYHLFTSRIPVRWGDMDALGHVNNTVYFRYMEQARVEWLEELGLRVEPGQPDGVVIVNASCTFLVPVTYPATVEVKLFVGSPGRSSIPTYYEMYCLGEETLYAEGAAKVVWIDGRTGKSAPLPEHLRARLVPK